LDFWIGLLDWTFIEISKKNPAAPLPGQFHERHLSFITVVNSDDVRPRLFGSPDWVITDSQRFLSLRILTFPSVEFIRSSIKVIKITNLCQ
jgi:hypothetical protein